MKWFDWVAIYLETDNTENRLLLRRWVYEPKQPSRTLYGLIQKSVVHYLEKIQELMKGDHMYYVRRQVNTLQSVGELAAQGLKKINSSTRRRYFDVWSNFVLMHIKLVYREYEDGVNMNEIFSGFIHILNLDELFVEGIRLFIEEMEMQPESEEVDHIVHNFMELITFRQVHPSDKPHQSTTSAFVAFSQIDHLGNWGPVL